MDGFMLFTVNNVAVIKPLNRANGCAKLISANGQLSSNAKVVREPKSCKDMAIPCSVK